ncbi:MAG: CinA family protein [Deltaproteobacteria bacterium]|nr:CinA family protein [Deltaproteobacteria bacterium]MBW2075204.1 CinA family protein [Deltaproteobacteria bacterium]RLB81204.1 MAG: competence protein ComA [Deltaproteobacteria bacterium]
MNDNFLEHEVAKLLLLLKITIAVAESCTGGLICHRLTNISGSSDYLERGVVTYSNRSKIELLGVSAQLIKEYGAVSEACVKAMATGIKQLAGTDLGLAVSGIAGPTGGTPDKPVGTVHMALAWNEDVQCWKYLFEGCRGEIKQKASDQALMRIRDHCQCIKHG